MNLLETRAFTTGRIGTLLLCVMIIGALLLISGRAQTGSKTIAPPTPTPSVAGRTLNRTDLKKLRWIEGTWRGTGGGVPPFVERYRFESDTTLAVEGFEGENLDKVTDVTRFELRDGEFGGGSEGSRYVASSIDDKSITFEPVTKARNSFRWERESENSWKAIISWPATDQAPAKQRIYQMERWPRAIASASR